MISNLPHGWLIHIHYTPTWLCSATYNAKTLRYLSCHTQHNGWPGHPHCMESRSNMSIYLLRVGYAVRTLINLPESCAILLFVNSSLQPHSHYEPIHRKCTLCINTFAITFGWTPRPVCTRYIAVWVMYANIQIPSLTQNSNSHAALFCVSFPGWCAATDDLSTRPSNKDCDRANMHSENSFPAPPDRGRRFFAMFATLWRHIV